MVLSSFSIKKAVDSVKTLFKSHDSLKKSLDGLKEQVEDHLNAINETTNEIQSNYEYSLELDSKINKLAERVEEIAMLIGINQNQKVPEIPKLTTVEKEIFLALYTLCEEKEYAAYKEIASAVNLSENLVMSYITVLIEKGVPVIKSYSDKGISLKLSAYFKNLQTRNNILKINEDISKQIMLNNYLSNKKSLKND